ncbi:hypothetical protein L2E82_00366 [Cichorium intybus]|uniref:Uncharacterized protein n=1 Tax=Cichorium intybus TaxID=13427 RepID=A0ACB9GWJ6_CICIN|nr:hypothetical protein L2E82_00366 [Cichorium intybus]
MIIKSKLKWVGLVGLVLSVLSLFTHFLLARYCYTNDSITEYQAITIFSWRPIFENVDLSSTCTEDYGAVRRLESLKSHAKPRECYSGLQIPWKTGLYITSFHHNFSTNPWKTWLQIILDASEIGYLGSFNFFQQPGIDTTAAARTAAIYHSSSKNGRPSQSVCITLYKCWKTFASDEEIQKLLTMGFDKTLFVRHRTLVRLPRTTHPHPRTQRRRPPITMGSDEEDHNNAVYGEEDLYEP